MTPQLEIIDNMMSAFAEGADIDYAIKQGLHYVHKTVKAEAASFFMLDTQQATISCRASLGPVDITGLTIPMETGIVGNVIMENKARFIADCLNEPDFHAAIDTKTGFTTKSMICAPVTNKEKCFGALQIINHLEGRLFSDDDAALVQVLANASALALSNSELTQNMLMAETTRKDMKMAARVQENLFPQEKPGFAFGHNIPMLGISGDLYDYVIRGDRLYFCMGDVSGKGINAALIMAKTHSLFRGFSRSRPDIGELMILINRELYETAIAGMFVTAIIGYYDLRQHIIYVCNAGHEPGLILNADGKRRYIAAHLPPLGICDFANMDFANMNSSKINVPVDSFSLSQCRFYAYSDGLTEAPVDNGMLGADRLAGILQKHFAQPLEQQIRLSVDYVRQQTDHIHDDLTLLGIGH